jgi:hypothetical protein
VQATTVLITYGNGSLVWMNPSLPSSLPPDLPATLVESIPNYLQALSAVISMDIGIWNNNSLLVSPDMFNANITPNTAIKTAISQHGSFLPPSFLPPNMPLLSAASQMRENPSQFLIPVESRNPAIIAISYLCHDLRRKSIFSFIICESLAVMEI